jgi:hypothetical protein
MKPESPQRPPWCSEPAIPAGSVGWRMGRGEGAHDAFYRWFSGLSDEAAQSYETENPEPADWHGFYRNIRQHPWV